jgi:hypothetical protein
MLSLPAGATTVIAIQVTEQGLVVSGGAFANKRMTLPKGTKVRLIFSYADANRNAHQFTLTARRTELKAPVMDLDHRTSVLEFTVGDRGEEFYRLSCELPCVAMEALTDYLIFVA